MRADLATLVVLVLWAGGAPAVRAQLTDAQKTMLAEFPKYMKSDDVKERVGQVEALGFIDGTESARLLVEVGLLDPDPRVRWRAAWALARKEDKAAIDIIRSEALTHAKPLVREGAARALGKMPGESQIPVLAERLAVERDGGVQVALLKALELKETPKGGDAAVLLLASRDQSVQIAAIDMLGAGKDKSRAAALHPLVDHKDWQVQAAALGALAKIRCKDSIPVVISLMEKTRGRLLGDARVCLMAITGNQYGYKPELWRNWWDRVKDGWEVPDLPPERKPDLSAYARDPSTPNYHQIETKSKKMLFLLDLSTSMAQNIRYRPRNGRTAEGQSYRTVARIDIAREELVKYLKTLERDIWFNIIVYDAEVDSFKPRLVQASPGAISEAVAYVYKIQPYDRGPGNYTKEGYQRGETNVFAALKWIYGIRDLGLEFTGKLKPVADTVFLLADGEPTCGELTTNDDILAQMEIYNQASKVVVHTISFDLTGVGRQLLADIARMTGGTFVELGDAR